MHSSRMHTTCLLTESQHALLGGSVPTQGVYLPGGICLVGVPARGYLPEGGVPGHSGVPAQGRGVYLPRGCTCPGGVPAQGVPAQVLPPHEQNGRCKNITLPQTSFAGSNNSIVFIENSIASCCSVDADTFCKRALNVYTLCRGFHRHRCLNKYVAKRLRCHSSH